MTDTWQIIDDRIAEMKALTDRMDATAKKLYWDDPENKYQLYTPDRKQKIEDGISITPNLPKVFAQGVISDLMGGKWQTVVEGDISKTQEHQIEMFVDDNFAQADEYILEKFKKSSMHGWLCNMVCVRYAVGGMFVSSINEQGEYKIRCKVMDMRWTPFSGKWVAPIYKQSAEDWQHELEQYEKRAKDKKIGEYTKISLSGTTKLEGRDYWNDVKHEIWVDKKLVYAEENKKLGYAPFAIAIPATGFMLEDEGYEKHLGEDILFPNIGLYDELARSLSLEQTAGYAEIYPGWEKPRKSFNSSKPSEPVPKFNQSQDIEVGEEHKPVPRGTTGRAFQTARVDIQAQIEAGGPLTPRQYNTPPSGVTLAGEAEQIGRLQNARKEALGTLRSQLARMMIDQFIKLKKDVDIGKQGMRRSYSVAKLGDPKKYSISYLLMVRNKRQELANLAMYESAGEQLPLEWKLENILMVDDVAGVMAALKMEKAKKVNPALDFLEMAVEFAKKANEMDNENEADLNDAQARILLHEYVMMMRQRLQPAPTPVKQIEAPKGNSQLLNQLGGAVGAVRGEDNGGSPQSGSPGQREEQEMSAR